MAKWKRCGLQNHHAPVRFRPTPQNAWVAELVYAHDLKSCLARDAGSTPALGTLKFIKISVEYCNPLVAQLVEHPTLNRQVEGSIPSERTSRPEEG